MNRRITTTLCAVCLCGGVLVLAVTGPAQEGPSGTSAGPQGAPADLAQTSVASDAGNAVDAAQRGEYLANGVAMCVICHSPRTPVGDVIGGKEFTGGIIPVQPTYDTSRAWAENTPNIRTLAAGDPEGVVQLLTTGKRGGRSPRAPMPPFRLSESDARAVVAYLRSIE